MVKFILSVFHVLLVVAASYGVPISFDDAASLLPEAPKTQNETVAAIVKDPVVQDAVDSFVGEGSLNGLVVKKNVVILPANEPEVILTQTEQILTAPVSHLENIRKNITDTVAANAVKENSDIAEVDEVAVAAVIPLSAEDDSEKKETAAETEKSSKEDEKLVVESTQEDAVTIASSSSSATGVPSNEPIESVSSTESGPRVIPAEELPRIETIHPGKKFVVPGINQTEISLPEGITPQRIQLPSVIDAKISAPVVAVVHPKNATTLHGSVISLLPVTPAPSTDSPLVKVTKDNAKNSDEDSTPAGDFEHPLAKIEAKYRYPLEDSPMIMSKARGDIAEDELSFEDYSVNLIANDDNNYNYERESDDMAVAEDMIFRPLFRYRQQQNERTRLIQQRNYQKRPYRRYRPYRTRNSNDYPGYGYRQSKYYDD